MIDMSIPIWFMFLLGGLVGYGICYLILELKHEKGRIKQIQRIVEMRDNGNKTKKK